ncbi:MAG: hypothetical protein JNL90_07875 [Planctomycetes bacterium]|nr:hypothetical protein [Planctomycetota bacterium]
MRCRTFLALPSVLLTTGCLVARSEGFATPQQTVATFQSAYARDEEFLEYDCFASELKEQGLTQQAWSTARGPLFAPLGALGRSALRRNELADNLVARSGDLPPSVLALLPRRGVGGALPPPEAELSLDYEIHSHGLRVRVVAEPTLLVPSPDRGPSRAFVLGPRNAWVERHGDDAATLHVTLGMPAEVAARIARDGVPWLLLERRYKLALPELTEPRELPNLPPERASAPARRRERPARLEPRLGESSLGVTEVRFALPITGARAALETRCDEIVWDVAPAASNTRPPRR